MKILYIILIVVGVVMVPLGGLWLLQGLDIVRIDPVACVGECQTITGGSVLWTIVGSLVVMAGAAAMYFGVKRIRK